MSYGWKIIIISRTTKTAQKMSGIWNSWAEEAQVNSNSWNNLMCLSNTKVGISVWMIFMHMASIKHVKSALQEIWTLSPKPGRILKPKPIIRPWSHFTPLNMGSDSVTDWRDLTLDQKAQSKIPHFNKKSGFCEKLDSPKPTSLISHDYKQQWLYNLLSHFLFIYKQDYFWKL